MFHQQISQILQNMPVGNAYIKDNVTWLKQNSLRSIGSFAPRYAYNIYILRSVNVFQSDWKNALFTGFFLSVSKINFAQEMNICRLEPP